MTDDEELEAAVDRAFLKLYGKTYRAEESPTEGDSLEKIMADFRAKFGTPL